MTFTFSVFFVNSSTPQKCTINLNNIIETTKNSPKEFPLKNSKQIAEQKSKFVPFFATQIQKRLQNVLPVKQNRYWWIYVSPWRICLWFCLPASSNKQQTKKIYRSNGSNQPFLLDCCCDAHLFTCQNIFWEILKYF